MITKPVHRMLCLSLLLSVILTLSGLPRHKATSASLESSSQTINNPSTKNEPNQPMLGAPEGWRPGPVLVVTNTNMEMNGDHWLPEHLIANPGPDGISLAEALGSVNFSATSVDQHEIITFDPSLMGAVITVTEQLIVIRDGLTIDGDLNDDGVPDITLDGEGGLLSGLWIHGASNVIVDGMHFRNFGNTGTGGTGIAIGFNQEQSLTELENISLRNNWVSNVPESCIEVSIQDRTHAWIRNVEISGNRLEACSSGVTVWSALGAGTSDNEISHIKIISNTMLGGGDAIGTIIRGAGMIGNHDSHRNLVNDVEIRGNTMTGFDGPSVDKVTILVDASNKNNCNDNTISNLVIAENVMDGYPMAIELVATGEGGTNSSGNVITGTHIVDNVLTHGGMQFVGTQAAGASDNAVRNVVVERNAIYDCANAGVLAYPGAHTVMYNNAVEDVTVRDNLVVGCTGTGLALDCENNTCASGNTISNIDFVNNTVIGNGFDDGVPSTWAAGIRIDTDGVTGAISNVAITNTVLWGNNFDDAIVGPFDLDEVTVAHSVVSDTRYTGSDGNFYADPQFVNPAAGNYRLQTTSPCVDAGDPGHALTGPLDMDRTQRIWDGDAVPGAIVDCGTYELGSPGIQEMTVSGAGNPIPDDDVIPVPWDGTVFEALRVAGQSITHTFTISNTGVATLTLTGSPRVVVTGTNAADFTVITQPSATLLANQSTTFTVAFDPSAQGMRTASLSIDNDDLDEHPYTFAIQGMGITPDIRIEGNDNEIPDGDTTPGESDGTDFGTVNTGGNYSNKLYVVMNTGSALLALTGDPIVAITGTHAADFTVTQQPSSTVAVEPWPYPVNPWPGFWISFQPQAAGLRTATVSIANDDLDENPYTFAVQGTGVTLPEVAFSASTYNVPEDVGDAVITVTLNATSSETVTVDYRTEALGNATPCTGPDACDYQPIGFGQLTFSPGETERTFNVEIVDDAIFENYIENLQVTLENAVNAIGAPTSADLGILDNEDPPVVAFSTDAITISEASGAVPITVTLQGQTDVTATVVVSTTGGTATPTADYTPIHRTLTFTPGVISQIVNLTIADDDDPEGPETVELSLDEAGEVTLGTPATATLTIAGDDALPVIAFSTDTITATEVAGTLPVTVTLEGQSATTATVVISTTGGTATPTTDYTPIYHTLIFTPGVTSQIVDLAVADDTLVENIETVTLALGEIRDASVGTPATMTLHIVDDEVPAIIAFSTGTYTTTETTGTAPITVTLSEPVAFTATVVIRSTGGTATPGLDYTAIHHTVVFTPGVTSQVVSLPIMDDGINEDDETVELWLSAPVNATFTGANPATLVILGSYSIYLPLLLRSAP